MITKKLIVVIALLLLASFAVGQTSPSVFVRSEEGGRDGSNDMSRMLVKQCPSVRLTDDASSDYIVVYNHNMGDMLAVRARHYYKVTTADGTVLLLKNALNNHGMAKHVCETITSDWKK